MFDTKFVVQMLARNTEPTPEIKAGREPLTLIVLGGGSSGDIGNAGMAEYLAACYTQNPGFYVQNLIVLPNVTGVPWQAEPGAEVIGTDTFFPNANVLLKALKETTTDAFQIEGRHVVVTGYSVGGLTAAHLAPLLQRETAYGQDSDVNAIWDRPTGSALRTLQADLARMQSSQPASASEFSYTQPETVPEIRKMVPETVDLCLLDPAGMVEHNSLVVGWWFFTEPFTRFSKLNMKTIWEKVRTAWITPEGVPQGGITQVLRKMFDGSANKALGEKYGLTKPGNPQPLIGAASRDRTSRTARDSFTGKTTYLTILGSQVFPIQRELLRKVKAAEKNKTLTPVLAETILSEALTQLFPNSETQLVVQDSPKHLDMHPDVMHNPTLIQKMIEAHVKQLKK